MKARAVILTLLFVGMIVTTIASVSAMIPPNPPASLPEQWYGNPGNFPELHDSPSQGGMDGIADQHAHDVTPDDVVSERVPEWAGVPYHDG